MAVKTGLLVSKIKAKYPQLSLSKTFIEKIAAKWAAKIETDDDIEEFISDEDRADLLTEASNEANRVRTAAAEAAKKPAPKTGNEEEETEEDETEGLTPGEKLLLKKIGGLQSELNGIKIEKTQQTIAERFSKHELLKDVPAGYLKGRALPTKEEEIETFAEALKADYEAFATEHKITIIGNDKPGASGGGGGGDQGGKKEIPAELQNYAANAKAKDEAAHAAKTN